MNQEKNPLMRLVAEGMKRKGIESQKALADGSGVHRSVVSRLFGGRSLSAENAYRILTFLDLLNLPGEKYCGQFQNQELAADLVRALLKLEAFGEHHLMDVRRDIDTRLRTLRLQDAASERIS